MSDYAVYNLSCAKGKPQKSQLITCKTNFGNSLFMESHYLVGWSFRYFFEWKVKPQAPQSKCKYGASSSKRSSRRYLWQRYGKINRLLEQTNKLKQFLHINCHPCSFSLYPEKKLKLHLTKNELINQKNIRTCFCMLIVMSMASLSIRMNILSFIWQDKWISWTLEM